jgi:DNA replication protein DnaC
MTATEAQEILETHGFAPSLLRDADCPHCTNGYMPKAEGEVHPRVCPCVYENQRKAAIAKRIERDIPVELRDYTLEAFQTGDIDHNDLALRVARRIVERWGTETFVGRPWVLGFCGPFGCGKTHLTAAIAIELLRAGKIERACVESVDHILHLERKSYQKGQEAASIRQKAVDADLLVLDDLGAETGNDEWIASQMFEIINERIRAQRPTIFTSNLDPARLKDRYSQSLDLQRNWSRIEREELMPPLTLRQVENVHNAAKNADLARELLAD